MFLYRKIIMVKHFLFGLIVLFYCVGCGNKNKNSAEENNYVIKRPEIPAVLSSRQDRAEFYVSHFWDSFDFSDTAYMSKPDVTENAFADYLSALKVLPEEKSAAAVKSMLARAQDADSVMFDYFVGLYEKYLYDPNSPVRDEELYIPVLEYVVNSDLLDEWEKLRPQAQLEMALKNRVGEKANDISFRTAQGKLMRLYQIDAEYIILLINNPDCNACAQIINDLSASRSLMPLIEKSIIKVVAVYPDEDISAWRNHLADMPAQWINGYDENLEMRNDQLYDLKAIPTIYLLDRDKTVLIKDAAGIAPVQDYIERNRK